MDPTPGMQGHTPGRVPGLGRDYRPGLRTLLVPRLLSRGLTPAQTARTTGVPMPLVTLIAEEGKAPVSARSHTRVHGSPHSSGLMPMRGRRNATWVRLLFVAAITAGCSGSILWHEPLLPIILVTAGSLAGNCLHDRLPAGRQCLATDDKERHRNTAKISEVHSPFPSLSRALENEGLQEHLESRIQGTIAHRSGADVLPRKIGARKKKEQPGPRFSQIVLETVQSN